MNGIPVPGTGASLISLGAPIVIQAITQITTTPSLVEVIVTGLGLSLALGTSASIIIEKLLNFLPAVKLISVYCFFNFKFNHETFSTYNHIVV